MNTQTKKRAVKFSLISLLAVVVVTAAASTAWVSSTSRANAENDAQPTKELTPLFSFSGATDWREGPSNETSLALFGKQRKDGTSACFASAEYKSGTIDAAAALKEKEDKYIAMGSSLTLVTTTTETLQTISGDKQYELHQYSVNGGDDKLMGGLMLGYLQLEGGYVKVNANCETTDELPTTIAALRAFKLEK